MAETKGWQRLTAIESKPQRRTGTIAADTEDGEVRVSAAVITSNTVRRGTRRIYTRNPSGTWTGIEVNAEGEVVRSRIRQTQREARDALRLGHVKHAD